MTKAMIFHVLFLSVILLSMTVLSSVDMISPADAAKSKGSDASGRVGVKSYGSANNNVVCGDRLCSEVPGGKESFEKTKETSPAPSSLPRTGQFMEREKEVHPMMHSVFDTITSVTDPLIGHESHQLATILPFSNNVYTGTVTFAASEKVQLVVLHGPLEADEVAGQPTVTTPEGVKYALTFVDLQSSAGSAKFAGNMLALHTLKTEPFDVTYSVFYKELEISDTIKRETNFIHHGSFDWS